jgi:MoaA/NifB/PqqE/SkfB family radical SAM enzyme
MLFTIDLELTNRCNARCDFCPRDATPHQGLMRPEVFDRALTRIVELRDVVADTLGARVVVSLCGLGEPLIHRDAASCVARIRAAGLSCVMSTNGSLLDERRGGELLAAGLQGVFVNVGQLGDAYEDVYGLAFGTTRDNVVAFAARAGERCPVVIVLVDPDASPVPEAEVRGFWRSRGIDRFLPFELANRGGALFDAAAVLDEEDLARASAAFVERGVQPRCRVPFEYPFIAYDGQYHLCASDWRRMAPLGSVFERSLLEVTRQKLEHVQSREPVCRSCNLDPINRLALELRGAADRDVRKRIPVRAVTRDQAARD